MREWFPVESAGEVQFKNSDDCIFKSNEPMNENMELWYSFSKLNAKCYMLDTKHVYI